MLLLLRLERRQKNSSNPFRVRIFLFLSFSFGIEMINTFILSVVPLIMKTIPDSTARWASVYPFSDKNGPKTLPDGAAHTYMAYIREYSPEYPPGEQRLTWARGCAINALLVNCIPEEVLVGEGVGKKKKRL